MKTRIIAFATVALLLLFTVATDQYRETFVVSATAAQATNSPYLSQMPAIERVMREVKGSDQIDTAARQAGVFWQLREVIDALAKGQGRNQFRLTADEEALKQKYYVAYYNVWQPVQKALAQDSPRLFKLEGYTVDRDLLLDVLERLGSPALRAQWSKVRGESVARAQAEVKAQQQAAQREQERWKTSEQEILNMKPPQQQQPKMNLQLARCLAAGRSECSHEGKSMLGLIPLFSNEPPPPGLALTGAYSAPGGFNIWFYPEYAHITCKDVKADAGYKIEMKNNQVQVRLVPSKSIGLGVKLNEQLMKALPQSSSPDEWQGQRIAFSLTRDGKLSGSGTIAVTGTMVTGSGQERDVYTGQTKDVTYIQSKTSRCTLGMLSPTGPSPVLGSMEQIENTAFDLASNIVFGGKDKDKTAHKNPQPGLKISGSYVSQAGFDVDFYLDSAVVSCRDATVARDYSVSASSTKVLVNIQNGATPIQLEYKPDGTLVGSGSIQVDGRMFVGMKDRVENGVVVRHPVFNGLAIRDPVFQPARDSCTLGVLTPGQPGSASTPASAATTGATVPAQQSNAITPARPNSTAASATPTGSGANAVLFVTSGFAAPPGASNPVAGKTLVLLKDSFENVLRQGGVQPPPGTSALKVWLSACASRQPLCQQGMMMGQAATATGAVVEANGRAQFSAVPPGRYFVFGSTQYNNQPFLWDLRVDLKQGTNAVTLDQRNSAPIN